MLVVLMLQELTQLPKTLGALATLIRQIWHPIAVMTAIGKEGGSGEVGLHATLQLPIPKGAVECSGNFRFIHLYYKETGNR